MRNRMYGGVRGRKTKVGEKLLRFPPTRLSLHPYFVTFLSTNELYCFGQFEPFAVSCNFHGAAF